MIKEQPTHYLPPKAVGPIWIINEVDDDSGEAVAGLGYHTEDAAWAAFNMLTKGFPDVAPDPDAYPNRTPADVGGTDETA